MIISLVKNSVYEDHLCRTTEAMTEVSRSAGSRGISGGKGGLAGYLLVKRSLPSGLMGRVKFLGSVWYKERPNSPRLASDLHTYAMTCT